MKVSVSYVSNDEGMRQASVVITAPVSDERVPTHFIAMLDCSSSMEEDNKLEHVKMCMRLVLKLLTSNDKLSIVTFGDMSRVIISCVKTDASHINGVEGAIDALYTEGCTNISAGLASVSEILSMHHDVAKPTLLLLTDGHANRGVRGTDSLLSMMSGLLTQFPTLSLSVVAYGTSHNAELLKGFAELGRGPYNIVETLEDAATSVGVALGGAMSCVAQNVEVLCPVGATISGPYSCVDGRVRVGDLFSGTDTMLLMTLPAGPVAVKGMFVPSMKAFNLEAEVTVTTGRNVDVELIRLRYKCSDLFRQLRAGLDTGLLADISAFREALNDPFLADNPITAMLLGEATSLEEAFTIMQRGDSSEGLMTRLVQHEAYSTLGGATQPIRGSSGGQEDPAATHLSPMTSRTQRRMADLMRTMSQDPNV